MFDLYFIRDFSGEKIIPSSKKVFSQLDIYQSIPKHEKIIDKKSSYLSFLERNEYDINRSTAGDISISVYGCVYTSKEYASKKGKKPWKLKSSELVWMYENFRDDLPHTIKGSFVLLIEDVESVKIITDALNVLPLYYYFDGQILLVSSYTKLISENHFVPKDIDQLALTELAIYDYMLEDHFYLKSIRKFENGRILEFKLQSKSEKKYWSVENLFSENFLNKKESLEQLAILLKENVDLYTSDRKRVLVSFTGGFDGRTNVAMIQRPSEDYLCYSYGKPRSKQISIPQSICKKLGIQYQPIFLDEEYLNEYADLAKKAIEFSNGTAPHSRANYPYAYSRLNDFSDVILTGLFGSEILRPYNPGQQIFTNEKVEKILTSENEEAILKHVYGQLFSSNLITPTSLAENFDNAIAPLLEYKKKHSIYGPLYPYFFFFIQEGIRKYFMQEIQIERVYVDTRFPYFDIDMVELIHKTPFAGMYNGFLGKSKAKRRNGQLLYAYIIEKYKPILNKFELDRGYTPRDLLRPTPINYLYLLRGVMKAKRYNKRYGNDTFDITGIWSRNFIESEMKRLKISDLLNNLDDKKRKSLEFYHFISMLSFLH